MHHMFIVLINAEIYGCNGHIWLNGMPTIPWRLWPWSQWYGFGVSIAINTLKGYGWCHYGTADTPADIRPICYIPIFTKCSLVLCSDSTPISSLILIYYFIHSILILTPFYNSSYDHSYLPFLPVPVFQYPHHMLISPIFVTMTLDSYVSVYCILYFLRTSI